MLNWVNHNYTKMNLEIMLAWLAFETKFRILGTLGHIFIKLKWVAKQILMQWYWFLVCPKSHLVVAFPIIPMCWERKFTTGGEVIECMGTGFFTQHFSWQWVEHSWYLIIWEVSLHNSLFLSAAMNMTFTSFLPPWWLANHGGVSPSNSFPYKSTSPGTSFVLV